MKNVKEKRVPPQAAARSALLQSLHLYMAVLFKAS
jgi:hypothetical protein